MMVVIRANYEEVVRDGARIIANAIRKRPNLVLGLATGSTPLGVYNELIRLHREEGLDFSDVVTFNLDEYVGLTPKHPQSYHYFMHQNLFDHISIDQRKVHIPDGTVRSEYERYCENYEGAIKEAGGIDLQLLGIGRDGHIGFNEPTSSLGSRTRVKTLTRETLEDNRRFFGEDEEIPECAITMGIGTILEAKRVVLLAAGSNKAKAIARAIEGPITASVTASALQLHKDVIVVLDEDAASELAGREYYRRVLDATRRITPQRLW